MTKVFAFDIDGTFIDSNHKVNPAHIDALLKAKEKGHVLVLCSGRPSFDMVPVLRACPEGLFDYLVCNNGAYIVNEKNQERIMQNEVPFNVLEEFAKLKEVGKFGFAVHTIDSVNRGNFWGNDEDAPEWFKNGSENMDEKAKYFKTWEETLEKIKGERIAQLSLLGSKDEIIAAKEKFEAFGFDLDLHIAGEIYLDVNPNGVDKMTGLTKLSKIINIPTSEFVVFGDSGNDLQMLAGAGLGIAMGNATQEAKDAADIVIGTNDTNAIADKVLELI